MIGYRPETQARALLDLGVRSPEIERVASRSPTARRPAEIVAHGRQRVHGLQFARACAKISLGERSAMDAANEFIASLSDPAEITGPGPAVVHRNATRAGEV